MIYPILIVMIVGIVIYLFRNFQVILGIQFKFEARMAIHQAYVPQLVDFKISPIHIREVIVYAFPYMQKWFCSL
jgi:hypothetical protein